MRPKDLRHSQVYQFTETDFKKIDDIEKPKAMGQPVHALMATASLKTEFSEATPIATAQSAENVDPSDRSFSNGLPETSLDSAEKESQKKQISHSWYLDILVERYAHSQ